MLARVPEQNTGRVSRATPTDLAPRTWRPSGGFYFAARISPSAGENLARREKFGRGDKKSARTQKSVADSAGGRRSSIGKSDAPRRGCYFNAAIVSFMTLRTMVEATCGITPSKVVASVIWPVLMPWAAMPPS
jgi:hypothetical protein